MKLKVEGLAEAQAMLKELGAGQWSENVMKRWGNQTIAKTKPYPPPRGYRRENRLLRNWYSIPSKTRVTIGNRAPYSGYVQQEATQAWFHKGYWKTIEDVAEGEEMSRFFVQVVKEEVAKILRKHG